MTKFLEEEPGRLFLLLDVLLEGLDHPVGALKSDGALEDVVQDPLVGLEGLLGSEAIPQGHQRVRVSQV